MNQATAAKPAKADPKQVTAADLPKIAEVARAVQQLGPSRLVEAEFTRQAWVATAHLNTQPQDLETPTYWAHVANKLRPWARIEVRTDDMTWYAECVVLEASKTEAVVKVLGAWNLTAINVQKDREDGALKAYEVCHRGPHEMWSVIRKLDREVVHSGSATEGGAYNWLKERLKAG